MQLKDRAAIWFARRRLRSDDSIFQALATLEKLAQSSPLAVLEVIRPLLSQPGNVAVRGNAIRIYGQCLKQLGRFVPARLAPLSLCFNDPERSIRQEAIEVYSVGLRQLEPFDPALLAPLLPCFNDPDSDIRKLAIEVYSREPRRKRVEPRMLGPLQVAIAHDDKHIRDEAAQALYQIGTPEAVQTLLKAGRIDVLVWRSDLVATLPELHDRFETYLRTEQIAENRGWDSRSRWRGAQQLAKIQFDSEPALRALLSDPIQYVRHAAVLALGARCTAAEVPILVEIVAVREDYDILHLNIAKDVRPLLVRLQAASLGPLIAALEDIAPARRRYIYELLGEIGGQQAADALAASLGAPDTGKVLEHLHKLGDLRGLRWLMADTKRFADDTIIQTRDVIGIKRDLERRLRESSASLSDDDLALLAILPDLATTSVALGPTEYFTDSVEFGSVRQLAQAAQVQRAAVNEVNRRT